MLIAEVAAEAIIEAIIATNSGRVKKNNTDRYRDFFTKAIKPMIDENVSELKSADEARQTQDGMKESYDKMEIESEDVTNMDIKTVAYWKN